MCVCARVFPELADYSSVKLSACARVYVCPSFSVRVWANWKVRWLRDTTLSVSFVHQPSCSQRSSMCIFNASIVCMSQGLVNLGDPTRRSVPSYINIRLQLIWRDSISCFSFGKIFSLSLSFFSLNSNLCQASREIWFLTPVRCSLIHSLGHSYILIFFALDPFSPSKHNLTVPVSHTLPLFRSWFSLSLSLSRSKSFSPTFAQDLLNILLDFVDFFIFFFYY